MKDTYLKNIEFPLKATARTAMYFIPAATASVFLGRFKNSDFKKYKNEVPLLKHFQAIKKLYENDAENIKKGFYLAPQNVLPRLKEYGLLNLKNTLDLVKVKERIKNKQVKVFETQIPSEEFPAYYRQNFHYQSGGYLSAESAELYDHQVELVFSGTAEAMRRHAIRAISLSTNTKHYPASDNFKILDIGCGTGQFTTELKRHFPMSEVIGLDLSPWYLNEAKRKAPNIDVQWKFGKAEKLPFEDHSMDIVSSIYLFHELPPEIRHEAMKEMYRVLKPGGTLVHMDSLQKGDVPELDPSLDIFPKLYHEPFYKSYVSGHIENDFKDVGFIDIKSECAFYSKILRGKKQ